jgi:hypothetical protein
MTETDWGACPDPDRMLDYLEAHDLVSARKQRLHDCACVRRLWHLLLDERGRRAVRTAERFADGAVRSERLREAQGNALNAASARVARSLPGTPDSYNVLNAAAGAAWEFRSGVDPLTDAAAAISWEGLTESGTAERLEAKARFAQERSIQVALLRDVIGSPFHPVAIDRSWLTWNGGTVVRLARSIYDGRSFDCLPVLADALEEAGCTNAEMLAHCRQPGAVHVRGCWVVDLLTGRQ